MVLGANPYKEFDSFLETAAPVTPEAHTLKLDLAYFTQRTAGSVEE